MLSVANKLSVIMLNVVVLSVVAPLNPVGFSLVRKYQTKMKLAIVTAKRTSLLHCAFNECDLMLLYSIGAECTAENRAN